MCGKCRHPNSDRDVIATDIAPGRWRLTGVAAQESVPVAGGSPSGPGAAAEHCPVPGSRSRLLVPSSERQPGGLLSGEDVVHQLGRNCEVVVEDNMKI